MVALHAKSVFPWRIGIESVDSRRAFEVHLTSKSHPEASSRIELGAYPEFQFETVKKKEGKYFWRISFWDIAYTWKLQGDHFQDRIYKMLRFQDRKMSKEWICDSDGFYKWGHVKDPPYTFDIEL